MEDQQEKQFILIVIILCKQILHNNGWQCPICKRILAPFVQECPCKGQGIATMTVVTTDVKRGFRKGVDIWTNLGKTK